jgi:hypothetical protein
MLGERLTGIPDPIQGSDAISLDYFNTHTGPSGNPNEIHNTSGNTSVIVND